jgi:hypothetical protein
MEAVMKAQKLFGLDGEWIKTLLTSLSMLGLTAGIAGCGSTGAAKQPPAF